MKCDLFSVVAPTTQLKYASLDVVGKIFNVYDATRLLSQKDSSKISKRNFMF